MSVGGLWNVPAGMGVRVNFIFRQSVGSGLYEFVRVEEPADGVPRIQARTPHPLFQEWPSALAPVPTMGERGEISPANSGFNPAEPLAKRDVPVESNTTVHSLHTDVTWNIALHRML